MAKGSTWCKKLIQKQRTNAVRLKLGTSQRFRPDEFNGDKVKSYKSGSLVPTAEDFEHDEARVTFDVHARNRARFQHEAPRTHNTMGLPGKPFTAKVSHKRRQGHAAPRMMNIPTKEM